MLITAAWNFPVLGFVFLMFRQIGNFKDLFKNRFPCESVMSFKVRQLGKYFIGPEYIYERNYHHWYFKYQAVFVGGDNFIDIYYFWEENFKGR